MKILVLIHEFPPVGGGGGRAAEEVCLGLSRRGHEVTVLTAHYKGLARQESRHGIQVVRLPSFRREMFRAGLIPMLSYNLAGFWACLRLFRRWRPDVIHAHFAVPAGALAWAVSRLTGIPYLVTAHLGDVPEGVPEKTGRWFRWIFPLTRPVWRDARVVVAVSEYTRQLALKRYKRQIFVIPNGVDVNALKPNTLRVNDPPNIVFAGRIVKQKNPFQVVRTLGSLENLNWKCTIIGDGPLMDDLKNEVAAWNMQDRFTLTGWITPEAVQDLFDFSDILFMPSLSEGLPVVGLQALAKGLAVVASNIGGFVDLVENDKNGYLIDHSETDGFARSIRAILSTPGKLKSMRLASLKKADEFDIDRIVEKYEMIFSERYP